MSLKERILDEIAASGPMTLARYIELALYDPEEGYYAPGARRAGEEWVSSPTLTGTFGATLAQGMAPLLAQLDEPMLIDAGTGGGELARDLCYGLHETDPDTFERLGIVLVDQSQAVLDRARSTLEAAGIDLADVEARTQLPEGFQGVLVANELLDALPVHLCQATADGPVEVLVEPGEHTLELTTGEIEDPDVAERAAAIADGLEPGTRFEVALAGERWWMRAGEHLDQGALIAIDYGGPRAELVREHPRGTVHAYRQGIEVPEVWYDPGQMDITYRVPTDELVAWGEQAGLTTDVLASQGDLLRALGIRSIARRGGPREVLAAKKLIDPRGAGGTFQVLVQSKGITVGEPWPTE